MSPTWSASWPAREAAFITGQADNVKWRPALPTRRGGRNEPTGYWDILLDREEDVLWMGMPVRLTDLCFISVPRYLDQGYARRTGWYLDRESPSGIPDHFRQHKIRTHDLR